MFNLCTEFKVNYSFNIFVTSESMHIVMKEKKGKFANMHNFLTTCRGMKENTWFFENLLE